MSSGTTPLREAREHPFAPRRVAYLQGRGTQAMSTTTDFVQAWLDEHVGDQIFPDGNLSGAKRLALRFAEDARTAGIDEQEVRDEVGGIENVILEALDKRTGNVDGAT
jgi:hypothetical protein